MGLYGVNGIWFYSIYKAAPWENPADWYQFKEDNNITDSK